MGRGTPTLAPSHNPGGEGFYCAWRCLPGHEVRRETMIRYLVRRVWQSLLVLFGISIIIFIILH
ncbi:MAG TPA: hypothetical protein VF431_01430, partial [Candidatus Methylomirabilis sp.]